MEWKWGDAGNSVSNDGKRFFFLEAPGEMLGTSLWVGGLIGFPYSDTDGPHCPLGSVGCNCVFCKTCMLLFNSWCTNPIPVETNHEAVAMLAPSFHSAAASEQLSYFCVVLVLAPNSLQWCLTGLKEQDVPDNVTSRHHYLPKITWQKTTLPIDWNSSNTLPNRSSERK